MSIDKRIDNVVVYLYNGTLKNHKKNKVIKKNKMMPFAATWMDLEIIILSETSQAEKDITWHLLYVES